MSTALRKCLGWGVWCALAGAGALVAGAPLAAAQQRQQPAPPPARTYPVEGPYGPYSDLVPNAGQESSANTPFAQLPRGPAPYPYGRYPAYPPPPAPAYPAVPSYTPALTPPPPAQPAYSQYPAPTPPPPEHAVAAAPARPRPQLAAAERGEGENPHYGEPLLGIITQMQVGILRHDAGVFGRHKEPGTDIDGEIRFLPISWLDFMASPRPHIGFHYNLNGATNQIFAGITWEFWFWDNFFIDPSFGLSFNDDCCLDGGPTDTKQLGSHVLFREAVDLGWNFYGRHSISILLDHVSHGHILASENEGLDSLGVRYGYRF